MTTEKLNTDQVKEMMLSIAEQMVAAKDKLCEADRAIGDGDHGIGIAKGFESVQELLNTTSFQTPGELLMKTGMSLMSSMGGASGAIFGSFFRGGGKELGDAPELDSKGLSQFLEGGLALVQKRGQAKPGDKTMVDALAPAVEEAKAQQNNNLNEALEKIISAAEKGKETTIGMVATTGKARALGERSLGHPDPGAISICLILSGMNEFVQNVAAT